ncbi:16S rRNA (cytosine(1402)-N(4))-methyltransferase RsmH [Pedosphaera parvula]|uniref:Ribosomal RNA small subunit methyltransferase H n=1 Tax=Pedosphaera parvula (strain Ellin514) TaxID=320771 RepID=B9XC91_PEDPL|nr:16S rRNA (cytosine(1402)-N(4))-methyltransferase RsmH [Pedosphaera parvula]EEF62559.1 S-adenosyl-methyltransferase MraW [Pedosphaera parvula Ellin514]
MNPESTPASPHKRRVRYSGRHPRRFEEKYKELNPERYGAEVQKIIESGKTPAGSHRSICVREIMEVLAPKPGEIAVDATLGYGGHALEILRAIQPGGRLVGLDVDPMEMPKTETRLRSVGAPAESLIIRRSNFAGLPQVLAGEGIPGADIILADLGLSSMQIDNPARGFTFKFEGPLDLRLNPERGRPASALLATLKEPELIRILQDNADEPDAGLLAKGILQAQLRYPITTTTGLAEVIREAFRSAHRNKTKDEANTSIRRVFQALRIAVNDEFGALDMFLRNLPGCSNSGGRVAILTFHSGEDRRVKKAFQDGKRAGVYSSIAEEIIRPSREETRSNPRASSAKLRWAIRA